MATYKTIARPVIEYANSIWSQIAAVTTINDLQVMQNTALRAATGCTAGTYTQYLHNEGNIFPVREHLRLHSSQIRQKAQQPDHPLHSITRQPDPGRFMKQIPFHNNTNYTKNIDLGPQQATGDAIKRNMKSD